ncbi:nitroreductase family deazaflavin-dependent oxidoreductase [Plantactinospora sp. GCM10030261]|uniref:nitroreductase family deazaflavin-dependent oxidoreductase n=1 Tax=Plantactinospora sp. GCM10030261 TaxID=3273420 RepID=UPI003609DC72
MRTVRPAAPPAGMRRLLFRLPVYVYRVGLGAVLGRRFLYLVHTGRVSGRRRDVVIETVGREGGRYQVCSGFGTSAQWYRNIRHNPDVAIQVGRHRARATAVLLDTARGADLMARYASRHPTLARRLCTVMGFEVDGSEADFREVGRRVPFVEFVPQPREHRIDNR